MALIRDILLPEYDHEMALTRRVLERVPDADLAWRPHEKSWALGALATHLANIPDWAHAVLEKTDFEMTEVPDASRKTTALASRADVLARFDKNAAEGRQLLDVQTDAQFVALWTFKKEGRTVFAMPRVAALRRFVLNHAIHHRGQLTVYLRLRNVPLPAIYGPSADEG